jgi:ribosomal protein S18 acetylase RimI-like enzyme
VPFTWKPLGSDDFDDLVALAERCLASDGGLPVAADPAFLRRRWTEPATTTTSTRDPQGRLIAAAAVRDETTCTGMVDPAARGVGLGAELLDWGLLRATTVESEGLTPGAEALFASRGLRCVFAEHVMRIDLGPAPAPPAWPAGTTLESWDDATVGRFHAVYEASFRERPGFPGWSAEQWIGFVADDDEFRPQWSLLATLPGIGDAGFVTAGVGWIAQVGVVPAARGAGLGAALLLESLSRMRAAGEAEAWLDVNVDNPARHLYERLGFADRGRRARYRLEPQDPAR